MPVKRSAQPAAKRNASDHRRRRGEAPAPNVEERLLAAIERLLQNGTRFGALSVEELAREAGIGRATFYLYFKNKNEMVARLMQRLTTEVADSAGDWFRDTGEVEWCTMRQALHGIIGTFKRHQAVLAAVADTSLTDPDIGAAHQRMMERLCELSRQAIRQVQRSGRGTAADPDKLADMLTWSIELYCARFIADYEGDAVTELVDLVTHVAGQAIFFDDEPPAAGTRVPVMP